MWEKKELKYVLKSGEKQRIYKYYFFRINSLKIQHDTTFNFSYYSLL